MTRIATPIQEGTRFGKFVALETSSARNVQCRCDCGTVRAVIRSNLLNGLSKSCGCLRGQGIKKKIPDGQRYGRLTLLEEVSGYRPRRFKCRCDCGNTAIVALKSMKKGNTLSCGCIRREECAKKRLPLPLGVKYGRLTVVGEAPGTDPNRHVLCQCDCGKQHVACLSNIRQGITKSCGCFRREARRDPNWVSPCRTHGLSKTRFYKKWMTLIKRCCDPKGSGYDKYGAKGVTVCERWLTFENFAADTYAAYLDHVAIYGMGNTTIDRYPISNGNYELGNWRWATWAQQIRNRTITRYLEFEGRRMCISDWARELGMGHDTISKRLKAGWTVEQTLSVPRMDRGPRLKTIRPVTETPQK